MPVKSSGVPLRPIIVRAAIAATRAGSDDAAVVSGVRTNPGTIALQVTPEADHCSAVERVSETRPPFDTP